ncbi:cytochrome b5 domain-containing protein [Aquimarina agarilytica]|uniref:cytochrome b5 domain-containing protein n=1 Tax=Aquimarina agarilytica TaxID=1087449 RepID=UPI000289FD79|nr:cytochrome b5 domain-containing protein [Aquimarina agarilytica]
MNTTIYSPSHNYIKYAEQTNAQNGHENLGFLSFERGFMPLLNPISNLPYPFNLWDKIASDLPKHYKNQTLRVSIQKMEVLDAENLNDKYLCRASMLMSILAHAYVRNERNEDLNIPESITIPWKIITKRLKRPQPFLSYIDLIIYNWKQKKINDKFELENLELLTPTVNNQEEQVFYLTQTEIAFQTNKIIKHIVNIQNAIIQNDKRTVIDSLLVLKKILLNVTENSFLKINPNPRSKTYVDPIVWAKTVAPFAVPIKEGVQGPSGTSSPFFHLIDTFIERAKYDTILGKEALFIREWYPEHWRNFLNAVEKVSITNFIKEQNDEELNGAFYSFIESYSGDNGFLGVHRRKVYGYLQMAFKVGRSVTIGGFSGLFKERTWEEVDDELETTRLERYAKKQLKCPFGFVSKRTKSPSKNITKVALDIKNKGITYRSGDRCAIVPKNDKATVHKIIKLLDLTGKEPIILNDEWKNYFNTYYNKEIEQVTIYEILLSAKINNVSSILSLCPHLKLFFKLDPNSQQISLVELVEKLVAFSSNVSQMLLPHFMDCLHPEQERMYSISSDFDKNKIELTIGNAETTIGNKIHKGVCSHFLTNEELDHNSQIPINIVRPLRFSLPNDIKNKSITLFAAGSGIAPFRSFWMELKRKNKLQQLSIFYCVKHLDDIIFKNELKELFLTHGIDLNIIITRDHLILDKEQSISKNELIFSGIPNRKIDYIILQEQHASKIYKHIAPKDKNREGLFYTCGKAGFALSILNCIKHIITKHTPNNKDAKELLYSLFSENRYMQDVFTSPNFIKNDKSRNYYISDIVNKNNDKNGYWLSINDKVYDVTEFKEIHPGGDKIIIDNSGRDGTHEFKKANHNSSKEIESLLSMYCIGNLKKVELPNNLKNQYNQWLKALQLCTEMLNTFVADFSFKNRKTTILCGANEKTPYKVALMVENQNRFLTEYVKNIHEIIQQLYGKQYYFQNIITLIDKAVESTKNVCDIYSLKKLTIEDSWDKLTQQEAQNKSLLELVQKLLWDGLKFFESYESNLDSIHQIAMKNLFELFKKELRLIPKTVFDDKKTVLTLH